MLIIPAIDLKDGCVVRYVQGRKDKKVYSSDPLKIAKHWEKQGAKFLHIVDLDGAFTGRIKNLKIVKEIAKHINIPIEFGGGVRKIETIKQLLDLGVKRVVLGTKAVEDKLFLKQALTKFNGKIIVGLDARLEKVMVKGWKEGNKNTNASKFSLYLKELGFKEFIYTDTLKDGTLSGANISEIKRLLKLSGLKIIASGGISGLEDISKLKKIEKEGVTGIIIGKALYEEKFTLAEAIKIA